MPLCEAGGSRFPDLTIHAEDKGVALRLQVRPGAFFTRVSVEIVPSWVSLRTSRRDRPELLSHRLVEPFRCHPGALAQNKVCRRGSAPDILRDVRHRGNPTPSNMGTQVALPHHPVKPATDAATARRERENGSCAGSPPSLAIRLPPRNRYSSVVVQADACRSSTTRKASMELGGVLRLYRSRVGKGVRNHCWHAGPRLPQRLEPVRRLMRGPRRESAEKRSAGGPQRVSRIMPIAARGRSGHLPERLRGRLSTPPAGKVHQEYRG